MNTPSLSPMRSLRNLNAGVETRRIPQGIGNRCRFGTELNSLNDSNQNLEGFGVGGYNYNTHYNEGMVHMPQERVKNVGGLSPDQKDLFPDRYNTHEYFMYMEGKKERETTNMLLFVIAALLTYKLFFDKNNNNF